MPPKTKAKIVKDVTQLVLARRTRMCNFLEYKGVAMSPQIDITAGLIVTTHKTPKSYIDVMRRYSSCVGSGSGTMSL
jgi:hypothetical protein